MCNTVIQLNLPCTPLVVLSRLIQCYNCSVEFSPMSRMKPNWYIKNLIIKSINHQQTDKDSVRINSASSHVSTMKKRRPHAAVSTTTWRCPQDEGPLHDIIKNIFLSIYCSRHIFNKNKFLCYSGSNELFSKNKEKKDICFSLFLKIPRTNGQQLQQLHLQCQTLGQTHTRTHKKRQMI